ncbi:MAG: hypothetical protein WCP70_12860 [Methanothrix sp.]
MEPFLGKGHPGTMAPLARRACMCLRSRSGAGGRSGLKARESRAGVDSFSGGWILVTAAFRYYY